MRVKALLVALALALGACSRQTMTNDDIIRETKKCEAAGMRAALYIYVIDEKPALVVCKPRDAK